MNYPPPNQFLHNLFRKSNGLLSNCGSAASLIILAPVSSSLNAIDSDTGLVYADNLTDEFVQSHILRVSLREHEVLDRTRARVYTTINNKSMVVKEDVIYPHRGFRGVKEVRILHDSLFWMDDLNQTVYLVYFLDRPLLGTPLPDVYISMSPSGSSAPEINSWAELVKIYPAVGTSLHPTFTKLHHEFSEAMDTSEEGAEHSVSPSLSSRQSSLTRRARRQSGSSITPALSVPHGTSQSFGATSAIQFLRIRVDLVVNSAMQAFQMMPQATLHSIAHESNLTGEDVEKLIETHIITGLYDIIFFKLIGISEVRDEEVASAVEQARYVDIVQLGTTVTLDLRRRLNLACIRFKDFGIEHEPQRKLESLMATIQILMLNSEKSSDDLIPSLVYVVLHSAVSNLCANILWIKEFAFMDVDTGEYGFALSTLEAVIYHITSSITNLAVISKTNQRLLNAVKDNDMEIVKTLMESSAQLIDVFSPDGSGLMALTTNQECLSYLLSYSCGACSLSQVILPSLSFEIFSSILSKVLMLSPIEIKDVLNAPDRTGQCLAHRIYERPDVLDQVYYHLDWEKKDNQGNTPLQVLARIYDHPLYDELMEKILLTLACGPDQSASLQGDESPKEFTPRLKRRIKLERHLDAKGNGLAHVAGSVSSMRSVLDYCSGNFNTINDKGLTPLLISIKFARSSTVEFLLSRPEIDLSARDSRGHSAIHYAARGSLALFNICVDAGLDINDRASGSGITALHIASREGNLPILRRLIELNAEEVWDWRGFRAGDIVKNDIIRSILDDWACKGREVRVLRGHVGDDCTVKYLIKSKSGGGVLRGVSEFQKLKQWMTARYPTIGIASLHLHLPHPCLLHCRPARSVLMATTERLDAFIRSMLDDDLVNQNPILWEFLLSPIIKDQVITNKIDVEVEFERQAIWREEKALASYDSTQLFFNHAREQIMQLASTYKVLISKTRANKESQLHLSVAYGLVGKSFAAFAFLGDFGFVKALGELSDALINKEPSLMYQLIEDILSLEAKIQGLCHSLKIPDTIIDRIDGCTEEIERHEKSLSKTPRLQLNLAMLVDSQTRKKTMIKNELQELHIALRHAGSELRHNEAILAGNLSTFYQRHEQNAVEVIRQFCMKQASMERERLKSMEKAIAGIRSRGKGRR